MHHNYIVATLGFAQARMYSSEMGRFNSVDALRASAKRSNPQTWNRYTYVLNRVTIAIDPDGLSTIIVVVKGRTDEGYPRATINLVSGVGTVLNGPYSGLPAGRGRDRSKEFNDTPFGTYRFGGSEGGTPESRIGTPWGTGRIRMLNESGEVVQYRRSGFYIHGGGSDLNYPYDPIQRLTPTVGCIRTYNSSINELIWNVENLGNFGDPLDRIFVGSEETLKALADQRDSNGNYLYPDLRLSLGTTGIIPMTAEERESLVQADQQRRQIESEKRKKKKNKERNEEEED